MLAIDLLLNRNSYAKLQEPAPKGDDRERIFQAALRAPDHAMLKPWRFLVVEGDRRKTLGLDMADVLFDSNPLATEAEMTKVQSNLRRAPLVIVAICKGIDHPKIPKIEQGRSMSQGMLGRVALPSSTAPATPSETAS